MGLSKVVKFELQDGVLTLCWALYAGAYKFGRGALLSFGTKTGGVTFGLQLGDGGTCVLTLGRVLEPEN